MDTLKIIEQLFKQKGYKKTLELKTKIKDTGIDSLDLVDVLVSAEKKYKITIADEKLFDVQTVRDLVEVVEEAFAQKKE